MARSTDVFNAGNTGQIFAPSYRKNKPQISQEKGQTQTQDGKKDRLALCPRSHTEFLGACPLTDCPANKTDDAHHCLYLRFGRDKLDRADILFTFKMNDRKLHDAVIAGQRQAQLILSLFQTLTTLRSENTLPSCPKCGIAHAKPGVCTDTTACETRKTTAMKLMYHSYFRFPEFRAMPSDIFLLSRKHEALEKVAKSHDANINELLGMSETPLKVFLQLLPIAR